MGNSCSIIGCVKLPNPALTPMRLLKVPHILLTLTHMMLTGWVCPRHGPRKTKVPTIQYITELCSSVASQEVKESSYVPSHDFSFFTPDHPPMNYLLYIESAQKTIRVSTTFSAVNTSNNRNHFWHRDVSSSYNHIFARLQTQMPTR